jgi:isopenicillin-N N-acyltransferase-like protein
MKTSKPSFLFLLLILGIFNLSSYGFSRSKDGSAIPSDKKVPVVEIKGNGYERGFQHGNQLKREIAEIFAKWKENIVLSTKRNADSVIAEFLKTTSFKPAIDRWTPGMMDEVKGIADGSGQKYDDVFSFQLVDEFWVYLDRLANIKKEHCSGIGVPLTKNHPACIAQNMDLETFMNGYQVLLHIKGTNTEPEQYLLTCAGLVVTTGMNEKGIGVCANTLMELQASEDGLPVAFVIRGILSKQNRDDVLSFMKTVKHASGQNYIIGVQDNVYDFEASANQIIQFHPEGAHGDIIYHTNHALVNHDVKPWYSEYHRKVLAGEAKSMNSELRFDALEKRLNKPVEEISPDVIKSTLRSKDDEKNPVCRVYEEGGSAFTFSSVLYTLSGRRSVQVTYGSPDKSEYQEHFFKK